MGFNYVHGQSYISKVMLGWSSIYSQTVPRIGTPPPPKKTNKQKKNNNNKNTKFYFQEPTINRGIDNPLFDIMIKQIYT